MNKKYILIGAGLLAVIVLVVILWPSKDLTNRVSIPYVAHQKPILDPQLPASDVLSDKLEEAVFDGLFNISANASGKTYENGLGELVRINRYNEVIIKLKPGVKWHNSYQVLAEDDDIQVSEKQAVLFLAEDISHTIERIQQLGSLSPDYILISQALKSFEFSGPDNENQIAFELKDDRTWTDNDIKEVFTFKIIPRFDAINKARFAYGTGPYLSVSPDGDHTRFYKNPGGPANLEKLILEAFIDNSTFTTEFRNGSFNALLSTPFGSLSPILDDQEKFFIKPNLSTTFFALLFNTDRLNREQRIAIRSLVNTKNIVNRFFRVGTEQERKIIDYLGQENRYNDLMNNSVFPSSSYYVEEGIVLPPGTNPATSTSNLPDTIQVRVTLNQGNREELNAIAEILNDKALFNGQFRVVAVTEEELAKGNYDVALVAFNGYRSNFLFDLYDIFLRDPNLSNYKVNVNMIPGENMINPASFNYNSNLFRLDPERNINEAGDINELLTAIYRFMDAKEVGAKQVFARRVDEIEQEMALGKWLFSLPSLNYFTTHFDPNSIQLYGVSSQLATIEKWKQVKD